MLTACHTMLESSTESPYEQAPYVQTKNSSGETVHVRERIKSNYSSAPIIYPTPLPVVYPSPVASPFQPSRPIPSLPGIPFGEPSSISTGFTANSDAGGNFFVEHSSAAGHSHLGLHLGFGDFKDNWVPRIGVSLFGSEGTTFAGFDGSMRGYVVLDDLRPFVGAGVYVGDTKTCTDRNEFGTVIERCEKKFLSSGFVEAGLEYKNFSVFWRDYAVNRAGLSIPTKQFFGIGLRF